MYRLLFLLALCLPNAVHAACDYLVVADHLNYDGYMPFGFPRAQDTFTLEYQCDPGQRYAIRVWGGDGANGNGGTNVGIHPQTAQTRVGLVVLQLPTGQVTSDTSKGLGNSRIIQDANATGGVQTVTSNPAYLSDTDDSSGFDTFNPGMAILDGYNYFRAELCELNFLGAVQSCLPTVIVQGEGRAVETGCAGGVTDGLDFDGWEPHGAMPSDNFTVDYYCTSDTHLHLSFIPMNPGGGDSYQIGVAPDGVTPLMGTFEVTASSFPLRANSLPFFSNYDPGVVTQWVASEGYWGKPGNNTPSAPLAPNTNLAVNFSARLRASEVLAQAPGPGTITVPHALILQVDY